MLVWGGQAGSLSTSQVEPSVCVGEQAMWSDWGLDRSPLDSPGFRRSRALGTGNLVLRAVGAPRELPLTSPRNQGLFGGRGLLSLSVKKFTAQPPPVWRRPGAYTPSPQNLWELGGDRPRPLDEVAGLEGAKLEFRALVDCP